MLKNEFEKVEHNQVSGLRYFINDIRYRRPHLHFDTEILYVIEGEGIVYTQQTEYKLYPGQIMVFNSCQMHEFRSNAIYLILQLPLTSFAFSYPVLDAVFFDSKPVDIPKNSLYLQHLFQAAKSYFEDSPHQPLKTIGMTYLVLNDLLDLAQFDILNNSQKNKLLDLQKRFQRISATIQENFVNGISLQELADQEGFSKTYFSHFFKKNFGISFQAYMDNIRCEYGRTLLLTTRENLLNVTNLCGFCDVRTFNKSFAKRYGCSPKDFRKLKQAGTEAMPEQRADSGTGTVDQQRIFSPSESLAELHKLLNFLNL
ncbi:MAG: AraC family transcriptional regulator [Streptococcaceae bacterium]|jgi:AraC-like DNA-binding protein|nr:AraC family transcriptional regulator [Streptococcaceae bacterium]